MKEKKRFASKGTCYKTDCKINYYQMVIGDVIMNISGSEVNIVENVCDLGVLLDSTLTLKCQINNVVRIAGYHLRNIAFIKKYLDKESVKKLMINNIISGVDYYNSIYYNLPKRQLRKLQMILNRRARVIKGNPARDRITPILIELHWLPIKARIVFNLCVLTHQALITGRPPYLRELLHEMQPDEGINTRRTTSEFTHHEPRYSSNIGLRAFSSAVPKLYNKLPLNIRKANKLSKFKKELKTFLFSDCYDMETLTINMAYKV